MTTAKEIPFKELTVKQYEFYKRKGMTDERVMKIHGYNVVTLNAWKKKHDLIGVKFEKDVTVTEGKLLREKEVAPERRVSSPSVDSKPADESKATVIKARESDFLLPESNDSGTIGEIPSLPSETITTPQDDDLYTPVSQAYLEERHGRDTQTIECLRYDLKESERKRKLDAESSDTWRNKYIASDKEKEKHVIENRNLKTEIEKMNLLLEQAYAKDALMDGVMKLYLDTKSKLNDSVEVEVKDIWR